MKISKFILLSFLLLMVVSCISEEEKIKKYLTGNWEAIYFKSTINTTYKGKDTLIIQDADFTNPEDEMASIKNFYTHKEDGSFELWQTKNKNLVGEKYTGTWSVSKDSLFYNLKQNNNIVKVSFGLKIIEDGYAISGLQAMERDGKKNDSLYIETVKLPNTQK